MHKWRKLKRLSRVEWVWLVQALLLLPLTVAALRLIGFRRWQAVMLRLAPVIGRPGTEEAAAQAELLARLVGVAARHGLSRANCLPQSLVLWWLLRRRGMAGELRIGGRKEAGRFEAHAWVELGGRVLNDGDDVEQRFTPFAPAVMPAQVKAL